MGRAARTDAGVHAAGNLVSIKIITSVPGVPDLVARVNEELPPEIRLWGIVRANRLHYLILKLMPFRRFEPKILSMPGRQFFLTISCSLC